MNNPTDDMIVGEWKPTDDFNILDVRDFQNFPQYDTPPYVLRFNFTSMPVEFYGILLELMGWNIPECQTSLLFSKIQVSKNGFHDVYYSKQGGVMGKNNKLTLKFDRNMKIVSLNDVMFITLFPFCPVHMISIERIGFMSNTTLIVKPPPVIEKEEKKDDNPILLKPSTLSDYWYIYVTLVIMILFLMISLLFMVMKTSTKKKYILVRAKK